MTHALADRRQHAEDMHAHYRWNAVAPFIEFDAARTLDVGGGDRRISVEVGSRALVLASAGWFSQVEVSQNDLHELGIDAEYDQVLAIDVLEHIDDDDQAIAEIAGALAPGGRLVISVPTPRHALVFGPDQVGPREGYWLEDLQPKLEAAGLQVQTHRYYTGTWVSRACRFLYGRWFPNTIATLSAPLVRPLLRATELTVPREHAASLALVAVKA